MPPVAVIVPTVLNTAAPITPLPLINAAFVTAPPVNPPPLNVTVPAFCHACPILKVPEPVMLKVPDCTGALVTVSVPFVATTMPPTPFTNGAVIVPKPLISAALVATAPAKSPPLNVTVPAFCHAAPTVNVPEPVMLILPDCTGIVAKVSVPPVAIIVPRVLSTAAPAVPKPSSVPVFVNIPPTNVPPKFVITPVLTHAFTTFNVPALATTTNPPLLNPAANSSIPFVTTTVPPAVFTNGTPMVPKPVIKFRLVSAEPVSLFNVIVPPASAMAPWLMNGATPPAVTIFNTEFVLRVPIVNPTPLLSPASRMVSVPESVKSAAFAKTVFWLTSRLLITP